MYSPRDCFYATCFLAVPKKYFGAKKHHLLKVFPLLFLQMIGGKRVAYSRETNVDKVSKGLISRTLDLQTHGLSTECLKPTTFVFVERR